MLTVTLRVTPRVFVFVMANLSAASKLYLGDRCAYAMRRAAVTDMEIADPTHLSHHVTVGAAGPPVRARTP